MASRDPTPSAAYDAEESEEINREGTVEDDDAGMDVDSKDTEDYEPGGDEVREQGARHVFFLRARAHHFVTGKATHTAPSHPLDAHNTLILATSPLTRHATRHASSTKTTDATRAAVAKQERERLRLQALQKKQAIEQMRAEQNKAASLGEVGVVVVLCVWCLLCAPSHARARADDGLRAAHTLTLTNEQQKHKTKKTY